MVLVVAIGERDQEARVGNPLHDGENPLRLDRFLGPRTEPASRMKAGRLLPHRAFSSASRMIRPWETPLRVAVSSSQSASSFVRRTLIV